MRDVALSPNGEIVVHTGNFINYVTDSDCKLYIGGINIENKLIDDTYCTPITASNDGKMVFYTNNKQHLSVYKDDEIQLLSTGNNYDFWFNNTASEILYVSDDSTYYLSSDMDEPIKVVEKKLGFINTPYDTEFYWAGTLIL